MHLYLSLLGAQSQEQIARVVKLLKENPLWRVLVPGGYCYTGGYSRGEGEHVFSPEYLRERLMESGVSSDQIISPDLRKMPHWLLNVVSTWGEVKQAFLLAYTLPPIWYSKPVRLVFVGVGSHMKRAVWLWRAYNVLMRIFGLGLDLKYEVIELENLMGEKWTKGEGSRNLIAYLDPWGVGPAFLIHLKRRIDARGAYPKPKKE